MVPARARRAADGARVVLWATLFSLLTAGAHATNEHVDVSTKLSERIAAVRHGAADYDLLDKYAQCILSPTIYIGGVEASCPFLTHRDTLSGFEEVIVDASRCRRFMPNGTDDLWRRSVPPLKNVVHLRPRTTDWRVFNQVYCMEHFFFIRRLVAHMPRDEAMTFLDAGANIGAVTILISQLLAFRGEVVAVEANPATLEAAKKNTEPLSRLGLVSLVGRAVTTVEGAASGQTLDFSGRTGEYWGFAVNRHAREAPGWEIHRVKPISIGMLAEMTYKKTFDFIKLDIEGEEKYIFEDVLSTSALCGARCLFLELHDFLLPNCTQAYRGFKARCPEHVAMGRFGEYVMTCRRQPAGPAAARPSRGRRRRPPGAAGR